MSPSVLKIAEEFSLLVRGRGTRWCELLGTPGVALGWQDTSSHDSLVTDSAAASAAWGSGRRGLNGMLNVFPDGTRLVPIGRLAKDSGRGFGLVTTATVTHATPAGFAANVADRNEEAEIATQYLDLADVILGGGHRYFSEASRADGLDLIKYFRAAGYASSQTKAELAALGDGSARVLGLFADSHLPYTLDQRNSPELAERVPTLAEMSAAALRVLARNRDGFLLQIEGARVDHAAHANDAAALLWDQLAFDDALGVALDFAREHEDTLLVVTSDHGNANPALNGTGPKYGLSGKKLATLQSARRSFGIIGERIAQGEAADVSRVIKEIREGLGFIPDEAEAAALLDATKNAPSTIWNRQHASFFGLLGQIASNHNAIGWTGVSHTADHVPLTATGPGCAAFAGLVRNDAMFGFLCDLMGITHRNPKLG